MGKCLPFHLRNVTDMMEDVLRQDGGGESSGIWGIDLCRVSPCDSNPDPQSSTAVYMHVFCVHMDNRCSRRLNTEMDVIELSSYSPTQI